MDYENHDDQLHIDFDKQPAADQKNSEDSILNLEPLPKDDGPVNFDNDEFYHPYEDAFDSQKRHRIRLVLSIIGITAVLAVTAFFIYIHFFAVRITVPSFTDKKDVLAWAEETGFREDHINFVYEYSMEPKDDVTAQSAESGSQLANGSHLTITLSNGPDPYEQFSLPNMTGKKLSEAKSYFEKNAFTNVTYTAEESDQEADIVLKMTPAGGSEVMRSDSITVTYSRSADTVTVADLSGMSREEWEKWAADNTITLTESQEYSDTVAEGSIISQSVAAGESVDHGSTIEIVVSLGAEPAAPAASSRTYYQQPAETPVQNVQTDQSTDSNADNVQPVETPQPTPQPSTPEPTPEQTAAPLIPAVTAPADDGLIE